MTRLEMLELTSELRAIKLWDEIYALSDVHDEVDELAWRNRRDRQVVVFEQLGITGLATTLQN